MHSNSSPTSTLLTTVPDPDGRPDPEVTPGPNKAKRRQFAPRYKLQVLEDTNRFSDGEIGAYLRRHGLYWSHLSAWRRLREGDALAKLASKKPGRKRTESNPMVREMVELRKELNSAQEQLHRASLILDIQKKVLLLCGDKAPSRSKA